MPSWDQEITRVYRQLKPGLVQREARLLAEQRAKERSTRIEEVGGQRTRVHRVSLVAQQTSEERLFWVLCAVKQALDFGAKNWMQLWTLADNYLEEKGQRPTNGDDAQLDEAIRIIQGRQHYRRERKP